MVARAEVLSELEMPLSFQFDGASGVGMLWRRRAEEEVWETEREDEEEGEEEVRDSPSKKRKENE